ncbi:carbohydrate ABC transporter permease [Lactonifactor longoviformis]|uniref:Multiple sugar transport system permease protein n=1 Tax=Lactonifactor longoviformis DSM 17459 TaxID=1122155 RepID=A0A1M4WAJ1_9CLOT|nr:sugar ABC transporter permease [Lactonifactor longoviformis]SHE78185.1 multiple sugar transport system permease protein [Lactonifactor longoviformis DSM 17459]
MKKAKRFFQYDNIGYLFVLPAFLYMLIFVGYPIVDNIILSFQDVNMKTLTAAHKPFAGLANYIEIFQDPVFIKSLSNTLLFTVCCLLFQFLIGFALAIFFNQNFKISKPVRGLLMMPWMIPITVTALIFKFIFGTDVGILNNILQGLGIIKENIDWLTSTNTAMFAIVCANVWIGIPFNMILISTGLTTIPQELYESASIDGAGKIQSFFKITLPLLKPTIESVLILGFIYTFKVFDLVYVMTGGGPVNSTHMLSTYSYKLSFEMFKYSKGSAVANVLFVILLIISMFYLRMTTKGEEE